MRAMQLQVSLQPGPSTCVSVEHTPGLQTAHRRYDVDTLGPKVGSICILGALGILIHDKGLFSGCWDHNWESACHSLGLPNSPKQVLFTYFKAQSIGIINMLGGMGIPYKPRNQHNK